MEDDFNSRRKTMMDLSDPGSQEKEPRKGPRIWSAVEYFFFILSGPILTHFLLGLTT